jgi:hypothetical protein
MRTSLRPSGRETLAILLAGVILAWQLILPGFIGMANNGDFGKIAGSLCIGGADNGAENFLYFKSDYLRGRPFCIDFGVPSSERVLAAIASGIEERIANPRTFDIRWLGALHALLWLMAYQLVLWAIRPLSGIRWWIAAFAGLLIFADVSYVAYLNSFYTDTAALLGAMAAFAVAAVVMYEGERARPVVILIFGAAALLYAASKGQHGVLAAPLTAFALVIAVKQQGMSTRILAAAMAIAILAGGAWVVAKNPMMNTVSPRFSLIFFKLLPSSATPSRDAAELGLTPEDMQYIGTRAFLPDSPTGDPVWAMAFSRRVSYATLIRFYLLNPAVAIRFLWLDLKNEAWQIRPVNLSNFRRQDGHPAGAKTSRMALWSSLRSWLLARWPAHMIFLYALVPAAALSMVIRNGSPFRRALAWVICPAAIMGLGEFCVASLCDALETYRHLLLFHFFTDIMLFFALVQALTVSNPSHRQLP